MVRLYPLIGLAVLLSIISSTFGSTALWAIAVVSVVALFGLLFAFYRRGNFVGPRILVDDAKERYDGARARPLEGDVVDLPPSRSIDDA